MTDSLKKSAANKFALIYQFNNSSPLFARVAEEEMQKKNFSKAIEILESGLELHPKYPTAYLMYAKAQACSGNIDEAKKNAARGYDLYDSKDSIDYFNSLLDDLFEKNQQLSETKRISFYDESINIEMEDTNLGTPVDIDPRTEKKFDDNLEVLAGKLSNAKLKAPPIENNPVDQEFSIEEEHVDQNKIAEPSNELISETLAGIYFSQGSYKEAKNIYIKLIAIEPDRKEHFIQKIAELDKKIDQMD